MIAFLIIWILRMTLLSIIPFIAVWRILALIIALLSICILCETLLRIVSFSIIV